MRGFSKGQVTGKWGFESEPGTSGFLVSIMLSFEPTGEKAKPNHSTGDVLQMTLTFFLTC